MEDNRTITRRIISGSLSGASVIAIIFFAPNWLFSLVVTALVGFGLHEFFEMAQRKGIFVYKYYGIIFGIIISISTYFRQGAAIQEIEPFLIVIISLFIFILQFTRKDNSEALAGISTTLLGILYIAWFFSYLIRVKFLPNGANLVMFLILVTKFGDIGAYVTGSLFGKHSLIPRISPKKSKEGLVGAIAASVAVAFISRSLVGFSNFHIAVLGLFLGILAQVGDLSESLIKRDCKTKDSGRLIPGMGGILDLVDSLLFTAPIFYFYVSMLLL